MTATKAIAGGIAANVVTVILWAISTSPGWSAVPEQPKAALIALVSAGIGTAMVYFAPANQQTVTETNQQTVAETAPEKGSEFKASFGSGRVLAGNE